MIAFGTRPVMPIEPSTTMTIGAMARIGIVCEEMIQGMQAALQRPHVHDQHREDDAEERAQGEAEQGGGQVTQA